MLRRDNAVAVHFWPIYHVNTRRWVSDQAALAINAHFNTSAQPALPIPLDPYRMCIFVRHRPLEIGFATISLVYGTKPPLLSSGRNSTYRSYLTRSTRLLAHHPPCGAVGTIPDPDDQPVQDRSARCGALFLGHLHFPFYIRNDSVVWEGEGLVVLPVTSQVTETTLAFNPIAPWHVSYIETHLLGLFTRQFSTQQRKHRVRLNVSLPASPRDLNRVLGIFQ